jgi:hypothetical protein
MRKSGLVVLLALGGCDNPPPECAPRGEEYEICSADQVWTCPAGPQDVVDFNASVDEACQQEDDPVQCVLDAEYQMVEMTLAIDCPGDDQICVEDHFADPPVASCEDP